MDRLYGTRVVRHSASGWRLTGVALLTVGLLFSPRTFAEEARNGQRGVATKQDTGNFSELAQRDAPRVTKSKPKRQLVRPRRNRAVPENARKGPQAAGTVTSPTLAAGSLAGASVAESVSQPTPPLTASFPALGDNGTVYNPDTQGAVGPNHLMVTLSSEIRIQNRSGGALSTVPLDSFWASLGASNVFDPRVLYDPYGQRWIFTAEADPGGNNPLLLIAVSQTGDPTGNWYRRSIDIDVVQPVFADAPNVGFTRDWITLQADIYDNIDGNFQRSEMYVFDKASFYAGGAGTYSYFSDTEVSTHVPAATYDAALDTQYLVTVWNEDDGAGFGYLRVYTINGPVGAETFTPTDAYPSAAAWSYTSGSIFNFAGQLGSTNRIYIGDSRLANVVYRNGTLWTAHTAFLPAGGSPTRSAIQWWEFSPGAGFQQNGLVQNAGTVYACSSVAVNRNNAALIGYSRFSISQYPSAAYSYRSEEDPLNLLRADTLLKAGEAPYYKPNAAGLNLWGDWSATVVDPDNDTDLWSIQEYAAPRSGGSDRWGTWWGRVTPPVNLSLTMTDSPDPVLAGATLTYTLTVTNHRAVRVDGVRVTNTLPTSVSFVSANASQGSCQHASGLVVCDLGRIEDKERAIITINVTPMAAMQISNFARVTARGPELNPNNNMASALTDVNPSADLGVRVTASSNPAILSSNFTYFISVTNNGPSGATGVIVTNTLPGSVTFISALPSVGTFTRTNNNIIWNIQNLAAHASPNMTIVVRPTVSGMITDRVALRSISVDLVPANNTDSVVVTVNSPPTLQTLGPQTIPEDSSVNITFGVGDLETPVGALMVTASSSNPAVLPNSNLFLNYLGGSNWLMTLIPLAEQSGNTIITRIVTDTDSLMTTNTFTLVVAAVNDVPTLDPISGFPAELVEDAGTQTVNLSGISSGAFNEDQALMLTASSSNPAILPTNNMTVSYTNGLSTGVLRFTPLPNANGPVTIMVTVNDGGTSNNLVSRQFSLNISPVNDPPTLAFIPDVNIPEDSGPHTVALQGLSGGPSNEPQGITVTATSSNPGLIPDPGVVYSGGATGMLTLTPASNVYGFAFITVRVDDNLGFNSVTSQVFTVTVAEVNDPPTLNTNANLTISEDDGLQTVLLTGISSGAPDENQVLTVTATTTNSSLLTNLMVDYQSANSSGLLTFGTVSNANGSGQITVTVRDNGASNNVVSRTFSVNVLPVNHPPTLDPIPNQIVPEDSGPQVVILTGISKGAPNESSQTLTFMATSSQPTIVPNPTINYTNGSAIAALRFTPASNASGDALITVTVNDGQPVNSSTVQRFTVSIMFSNDPPTISAIVNRTVTEDTSTNITFQVGDQETAPGSLNVVGTSLNQTVVPDSGIVVNNPGGSNRVVTVTPAPNQSGSVTITMRVTDEHGGSADQIFILTVVAVNDPPTIDPIGSFSIDEDAGPRTLLLTGLSGGPSDEPQGVTLSVVSSNTAVIPTPTIVNNGNGTATLSYRPNNNANGDVPMTVTVRDSGTSNNVTRQTFTVRVNSINDLPIISDISPRTINEDTTLTVSFRVDDAETPSALLRLDGQSSNEELISSADIMFGGSGTNRTVIIRPLTNQFGSAAITITVTDSNNASVSTFFEVMINSVNDPPGISPLLNVLVRENASTPPIPFMIGDAESPVSALTVTASSSNPSLVPNSNVVLSNNGPNWTVTLTPLPNQNGTSTISIRVSDGQLTSTNSFLLSVNNGPDISNITNRVINEDTFVTIPFTIADVETPAGSLQVAASSSNPALISTQNMGITFGGSGSNRTVTLRPVTNQSGSAFITIYVNDTQAITNSITFELTVLSVNDLPTILDLFGQITAEETPIDVFFRVSDVETPAENLIVTGLSANPGLVPNANLLFGGSGPNRTVNIRPAPNLTGTAAITIFVVDSRGGIGSNIFVLTVNGLNDSPTISSLPSLAINEDTPTGPLSLTVGDLETPAANLTMSGSATVPSLISSINFGGSGANRTVTISPAANQNGVTTIQLNVSDGTNTASTSFQLTINPVNDPPTLLPPGNLIIPENSGLQTVILRGLTGGPVNESQNLTVTATTSNPGLLSNLNVNYIPGNTNASLTFVPVANRSGTGMVTVTVMDGPPPNNITSQSFTVIVSVMNNPPSISGVGSRTILEDTSITIPFTIQDPDTPPWDLVMTGSSGNTALVANTNIFFEGTATNRTVTLVPTRNATGSSVITLTVSDGTTGVPTLFNLTVTNINDPPTLDPIADVIRVAANNLNITVNLAGISAGGINEAQSINVTTFSSNTSLVPTPTVSYSSPSTTGSLTFRVPNNASGSATVTVTVSDGPSSFSRSFGVYVRASANSPPTLSVIANRTIGENAQVSIPFTVTDATTPQSQLTLAGRSSNQDLIPDANVVIIGNTSSRTLNLMPLPNRNGASTITLSANDTENGSTNISFVLTVTNVNDRPTLSALADIFINEDSSSPPIAFTVSDVETPAGNLTMSGISGNQTLVPNANIDFGGSGSNRVVVITPAANQSGIASITVTVSDGTASTSANFTVTVIDFNDAPEIVVTNQTMNQDTVGVIPFTVIDVDTPAPNLTVTASSSNPALVPDSNLQPTGTGNNRSLTITPLPNQVGTATITMGVSDGSGGTNMGSFLLTVNPVSPVNHAPTLNPIGNVTYSRATSVQVVDLTGIGSGAPGENETLMVAASSSNIGLVPHPLVSYSSPNSAGTLTLTATGASGGTAVITVTVNDGQPQNNIAMQTFTVTVNALPTISNIAVQSTPKDTPTGTIQFTIGDAETLPGNLQLRGASSNTSLVPDQNIDLGGTGANRTVRVIPAPDQFGSATITMTVTDENGASASTSFLLVVAPPEGTAESSFLQIARLGNNRVLISWPSSAQGFTLQSGNGSGFGAWAVVADVPVAIGERYYVTNLISGSQRLYRLVQGVGLNITRSGGNVIIAWPFPSTGFVLESRNAFSGSWTPVGATPIRVGDQNTVTLNAAGASQFFRLRGP